jgi:hypothetical protein
MGSGGDLTASGALRVCREDAEAVLLAATTEIKCPAFLVNQADSSESHRLNCACRGSAVLRVLPTTKEG